MRNRSSRIRTVAFVGITASVALLLAYVEFLLPPLFVSVPGIKAGLPNVIILYVLYCLDTKYAALVSFVRIFLLWAMFGNAVSLAYSVAGAVLSLLAMSLMKRTNKFSTVGVSVTGGVMHNLGQILVAMVILDTSKIAYYLLVLAVTGTISGIFIGLCGALLVKRIPKERIFRK